MRDLDWQNPWASIIACAGLQARPTFSSGQHLNQFQGNLQIRIGQNARGFPQLELNL